MARTGPNPAQGHHTLAGPTATLEGPPSSGFHRISNSHGQAVCIEVCAQLDDLGLRSADVCGARRQ